VGFEAAAPRLMKCPRPLCSNACSNAAEFMGVRECPPLRGFLYIGEATQWRTLVNASPQPGGQGVAGSNPVSPTNEGPFSGLFTGKRPFGVCGLTTSR
jgi:hypothetical protein